jgi:propionyl-CoA carboxylase alpha chain
MTTPTTYLVTLGERVVSVAVRRDAQRVYVSVDGGLEQPVSLTAVHGPLHALVLGDRRTEVLAARSDRQTTAVAIRGLEYRAEVVDAARARLASVAGGRTTSHARRELKAPMPGLLVKLLCAPGDTVEPGQPLAVLQAMKMENELSLPRGGTVASLNAEPGQTVEQGQVLLIVE